MIEIKRLKQRARLIRPLLVPLILYIGLLAFSISYLEAHPETSSAHTVMALLPTLPGLWMAFGITRAITKLDELERRTLSEGLSMSFAATLILVMTLGLLEQVGYPTWNGVYIGLFMVVMWLVGKLWAMWRYR